MYLKTAYRNFWQKYGPRGVENSSGSVYTRGRMNGRALEAETAAGEAFNPELGNPSRVKSTDSFALFRSARSTTEAAFLRIGGRSTLTNLISTLLNRSKNTVLDLRLARRSGVDQVVVQNNGSSTTFGANIALEKSAVVDLYINDSTTGKADINFIN